MGSLDSLPADGGMVEIMSVANRGLYNSTHAALLTLILCVCSVCVSVCADNNHVRTWTVTRFRGMISTQPGSTPLASFKILSLEETESHGSYCSGNDIGERDKKGR